MPPSTLPTVPVSDNPADGNIVTLPHPDLPGETIRRFTENALQSQIDKAVSQLPEGKKVAVTVYANLEGELMGAVVYKISDQWSLVAVGDKRPGHKLAGEGAIRWSK